MSQVDGRTLGCAASIQRGTGRDIVGRRLGGRCGLLVLSHAPLL